VEDGSNARSKEMELWVGVNACELGTYGGKKLSGLEYFLGCFSQDIENGRSSQGTSSRIRNLIFAHDPRRDRTCPLQFKYGLALEAAG
jgi:hypothetical protein